MPDAASPAAPAGDRFPPGAAWRFALAYTAVFIPFGIFTPYLQVLLEERGFGREAVGLIQGTLEVVAIASPPLWGYLSDATGRPRLVLGLTAAAAAPVFLCFGLTDTLLPALAVALLCGVVYRPVIPLTTGLTFRFIRRHGGDYGRVRVFGSIAFILPIGVLELLGVSGPRAAVYILAGFGIMQLLQALSVTLLPPDAALRPAGGAAPPKPDLRVFLQRGFVLFILSAFLGRLAMMSYYHFFSLYLKQELGFAQVGWIWILGPLSEVPIIYASRRLLNRIGVRGLFALGLGGIAVRLVGLGLATSVWHVIPLQLLHALTFGAYHVASVTCVSRLVPEHMASSAQTVFSAFTMSLAGLVGGVLSGWVSATYGYGALYGGFGVVAGLGLVLFLLAVPKASTGA